ncbi:integrase catalytic domain-containing protein [Trichonephila clavipes]|nr:integrase catalytic domain-containing protein [Trichonephila clavipes]
MSRFGGLSEERPSVFKTRSKLGTHLSTQCSGDSRQSRPCAARRGKCTKLYSDNATNFVGANIKLKKMFNLVYKPDEALASYMASERIDWKFLPPRAPNKRHFEKKNAKIGDIVIIKEDNLPSCQWSLGRINNIYPGKDSKNLGGRTGNILRPSSVALKSKNQEINRLQLAVKLPWAIFFESVDILFEKDTVFLSAICSVTVKLKTK